MSGPKISVYSLDGRARKIVMGQINCEQQALACAEQIRMMLISASGMKLELDKSLAILELLQKRDGGQEQAIAETKSLQDRVNQDIKCIQRDFNSNIPRVSSRYTISAEDLEKKKQDLERIKVIRNRLQELLDEINKAVNVGKEAGKVETRKVQQKIAEYLSENELDEMEKQDLPKLESSIMDNISGVFSFDDVEESILDTDFDNQKKIIRNKLMGWLKLKLSSKLADEIKNALTSLERITQMSNLTTFDSVTVKRISRSIEAYQMECEKERAEFEETITRYRMLCDMAGRETEKKHEFRDIAELEAAINELETAVVKQKEQTYIADCVDEVMEEMGYDLIGQREVCKKSGKRFKNELYRFEEGKVVNITYSSEGQISMELAGIAREDRIPTEDEASVLTQDMETFCGKFSEFEKRMKAKGVIVGNRVALMPPTAEYAAIINVSDYNMAEGKQISEMNVVTRRKKAVAEKKNFKRGE